LITSWELDICLERFSLLAFQVPNIDSRGNASVTWTVECPPHSPLFSFSLLSNQTSRCPQEDLSQKLRRDEVADLAGDPIENDIAVRQYSRRQDAEESQNQLQHRQNEIIPEDCRGLVDTVSWPERSISTQNTDLPLPVSHPHSFGQTRPCLQHGSRDGAPLEEPQRRCPPVARPHDPGQGAPQLRSSGSGRARLGERVDTPRAFGSALLDSSRDRSLLLGDGETQQGVT